MNEKENPSLFNLLTIFSGSRRRGTSIIRQHPTKTKPKFTSSPVWKSAGARCFVGTEKEQLVSRFAYRLLQEIRIRESFIECMELRSRCTITYMVRAKDQLVSGFVLIPYVIWIR